MSFVPNFTQADVKKRTDKFLQVIGRQIFDRLKYLGEMCVTHAKEVPQSVGFTDQTGNLRSSIGYMIFKDGVAIHQSYEIVKEGAEGAKSGKMLAEKIGAKFKNGYVLVVTAGMSYAIHVEAKGRDVLTSAEMLAKQELPKMLEELKRNINKALS